MCVFVITLTVFLPACRYPTWSVSCSQWCSYTSYSNIPAQLPTLPRQPRDDPGQVATSVVVSSTWTPVWTYCRLYIWLKALSCCHEVCLLLICINIRLHIAGDIYVEWLELRYHCLSVTPDVLSLLCKLRQHYVLGMITNGPSRAQWEKVERLDLERYFDCILVSGDLPWEKPHRNIFLEACHYLGVQPWQCLMVGDKLETDIQGGIEASLGATVWVPLCMEHPSNLKPCPDFTLASITDLPRLLPSVPKSLFHSRHSSNNFPFHLPEIEDCSSNSSDGSWWLDDSSKLWSAFHMWMFFEVTFVI